MDCRDSGSINASNWLSPVVLRNDGSENDSEWISNNFWDLWLEPYGIIRLPIVSEYLSFGTRKRVRMYAMGKARMLDYHMAILRRDVTSSFHNITLDTSQNCDLYSLERNANVDYETAANITEDGRNQYNGAALQYSNNENVPRELINADNLYRRNLTFAIELVLSELERNCVGSIQQENDFATVLEVRSIRIASCFIRPQELLGDASVIFAIGNGKWRRDIFIVAVTVGNNTSKLEIICSCPAGMEQAVCIHEKVVMREVLIRLRLLSILRRNTTISSVAQKSNQLVVIQIPSDSKQDYACWFVFKRGFVGSVAAASSVVTFDCRRKRLRNNLKHRLLCRSCIGAVSNIGLCSHTHKVLDAIKSIELDDSMRDTHVIGLCNNGTVGVVPKECVRSVEDCTEPNIAFQSWRTRNIFPCSSEEILMRQTIKQALSNSNVGEKEPLLVCCDEVIVCNNCNCFYENKNAMEGCFENGRRVMFHTLNHGSMEIIVRDFRCACGGIIRYDGLFDGIFCVSKFHAFSRELLDSWMFDVCGLGLTFRETFSSWKRKANSVCSDLLWVKDGPKVSRRIANDAMNLFMKKLQFSNKSELKEVFSCKTCSYEDENQSKIWIGVVMDGTATGILGTVPYFQRPVRVVQAVKRISDLQYLMRTPKSREFTDALFVSAKRNEGRDVFKLELSRKLRKFGFGLVEVFFQSSLHEPGNDNEQFVRPFIHASYHLEEEIANCMERSSDGEDDGQYGIKIRHRIEDLDVRRTVVEFGRCYISGSIPGFVLRKTSSCMATTQIVHAFRSFSECAHKQYPTVCNNCIREMENVAKRIADEIPAVARMSRALCDASLFETNYHATYRQVASSAVIVIQRSLHVRRNYFSRFESCAGDDIRNYNQSYRDGMGLNISSKENWLEEASNTGQVFPSNPIVRPGIDFGRTGRNESSQSCRKNFRASKSHSPGIFTVQCVCKFPKVIGISVMEECEGTSTALSVLLSRFKTLPKVCYYDDSCNLAKSIILRTPWVNENCLIASDRFHYRGHKCNIVCDPDSYSLSRMHSTSGAESINQQWNFSKSHIRFLGKDNLIPFLAIRAIFINIRASIRERFGIQDFDDAHYQRFIRSEWKCNCLLCKEIDNEGSEV